MPRQYHFVWSGSHFPAAYRFAVTSALAADPESTARIHVVGRFPEAAAFSALSALPRVTVEPVDPHLLFSSLPAHLRRCEEIYRALPKSAASAQSNMLRYALIYLHGGVYIDFDAIVLRPLHDLSNAEAFVGIERVWSGDVIRVEGRWPQLVRPRHGVWVASWLLRRMDSRMLQGRLRLAHRLRPIDRVWSVHQANNAVIGAHPRSAFVAQLLWETLHVRCDVRYALGPTLIDRVARSHPDLVERLQPDVLYQVPPGESYRFFEDRTLELDPSAALVHYVGSNHRKMLSSLRLDDSRFEARPELFWSLARPLLVDNVLGPQRMLAP